MKNRRSILTGIFVCALLCAGIPAAVTGPAAEAVQITATGDDIVYPVALATGKDAAGHTVFPDQKFLQYIKQETFSSGQNRGLPLISTGMADYPRKNVMPCAFFPSTGGQRSAASKGLRHFRDFRSCAAAIPVSHRSICRETGSCRSCPYTEMAYGNWTSVCVPCCSI